MNFELFIENRRADVSADLPALLNFALDDIKDFGSRNTNFSKVIVLPGTARNNQLFGNYFMANSGNTHTPESDNIGYNFNAAKGAYCVIFQNNIQCFKGTLRILRIIENKGQIEYEVSIFGELGGLIIKMGNGKLEDLDFSAYDHTYNATNIANSWDTINGSSYYYPLIDYGTYGSGTNNKQNWDIKTFRPAFYVKEYIDKIFTAAGYTYTSALFDTARFKSLIVPHNRAVLTSRSTEIMEATITSTKNDPVDIAWDAIDAADFTLENANKGITYNGGAAVNGTLTFTVVGEYKNKSVIVTFKKNGSTIYSTQYDYTAPGIAQFFSFTTTYETSFSATDYITCTVTFVNETGSYYHKISLCTVTFDSDAAQDVELDYLDTVVANDCIPKNIYQKDFFTSIIKLFNLYVYEDRFTQNFVYITPYVDFYDTDPGNAVDFTYKLNRDKVREFIPMSELTARYYDFNFKADGDYYNDLYKKRYNQTYGSYTYDSAFEFANEKETVDLIFSGTPLVGYSGEDKVYSTILKIENSTEVKTDSNIRILQAKKITGVASWDLKDGVSVLASYTKYGYAGHYDDPDAPANDIHFGAPRELFFTLATGAINVHQFNVYWSPYMAEIVDKDSKLMRASFYLSEKDIFNLDFSKFVHVDGVLFRLNKVIDWNASAPGECKCELLRVVNTTY